LGNKRISAEPLQDPPSMAATLLALVDVVGEGVGAGRFVPCSGSNVFRRPCLVQNPDRRPRLTWQANRGHWIG
jgi:hypothetical protein